MWIFLNDAFLSVVKHRTEDVLLVRSRIAGDIERTIPGAEVFELGTSDYRYRAHIARETLKAALCERIDAIDYENFKSSLRDRRRHDAYFGVWQVLADEYGSYGKPGRDNP